MYILCLRPAKESGPHTHTVYAHKTAAAMKWLFVKKKKQLYSATVDYNNDDEDDVYRERERQAGNE